MTLADKDRKIHTGKTAQIWKLRWEWVKVLFSRSLLLSCPVVYHVQFIYPAIFKVLTAITEGTIPRNRLAFGVAVHTFWLILGKSMALDESSLFNWQDQGNPKLKGDATSASKSATVT